MSCLDDQASAVDLTFASALPLVVIANVESKTALNLIFASIQLVLTFAKNPPQGDVRSRSRARSRSCIFIPILYEQAQRLLFGDIYRRFKSVMAHSQQCICKAPKNDRCLTPSI